MQRHARIVARNGWIDTGIELGRSDGPVTLDARGLLKVGRYKSEAGPGGSSTAYNSPADNALGGGALFGRLGTTVFPIGTGGLVPPSALSWSRQKLEVLFNTSVHGTDAEAVAGVLRLTARVGTYVPGELVDSEWNHRVAKNGDAWGLVFSVRSVSPSGWSATLAGLGFSVNVRDCRVSVVVPIQPGATLSGIVPPGHRSRVQVTWSPKGGSGSTQGTYTLSINNADVATVTGTRRSQTASWQDIQLRAVRCGLGQVAFLDGAATAFLNKLHTGAYPDDTTGVFCWPELSTQPENTGVQRDLGPQHGGTRPTPRYTSGKGPTCQPFAPAPGNSLSRVIFRKRDAELQAPLKTRATALDDKHAAYTPRILDGARSGVVFYGQTRDAYYGASYPRWWGNQRSWSGAGGVRPAGDAWGVDAITGASYFIAPSGNGRHTLYKVPAGLPSSGSGGLTVARPFTGLSNAPSGHTLENSSTLAIEHTRNRMFVVTADTKWTHNYSGNREFVLWVRSFDNDWFAKVTSFQLPNAGGARGVLSIDLRHSRLWFQYNDQAMSISTSGSRSAPRAARDLHHQPILRRLVWLDPGSGEVMTTSDGDMALSGQKLGMPKVQGACRLVAMVDKAAVVLAVDPAPASGVPARSALDNVDMAKTWIWQPGHDVREGTWGGGGLGALSRKMCDRHVVMMWDPRVAHALQQSAPSITAADVRADGQVRLQGIHRRYHDQIADKKSQLHTAHANQQQRITDAKAQARRIKAPGYRSLTDAKADRTRQVVSHWKSEHKKVDQAVSAGTDLKSKAKQAAMAKLGKLLKELSTLAGHPVAPDTAINAPEARFHGAYGHVIKHILDAQKNHQKKP